MFHFKNWLNCCLSKKKSKRKQSSSASGSSTDPNRTALSNVDGPPAPPDFVFTNTSTPGSSLKSDTLSYDLKTNIDKLPKNTEQVNELETAIDNVNRNLKKSNVSISDVTSTTQSTTQSSVSATSEEKKINNEELKVVNSFWEGFFVKYTYFLLVTLVQRKSRLAVTNFPF